jgi:hypothetical protein
LWGDSHAAHLYPGLASLQSKSAFRIQQFTSSSCPPIVGLPDPADVKGCNVNNTKIFSILTRERPQIVILSAFWSKYSAALLPATVKAIKQSLPQARLVLIGPVPVWDPPLVDQIIAYYKQNDAFPKRLTPNAFDRLSQDDRQMRTLAEQLDVTYISALKTLCDTTSCLTRVGDAAPDVVTFDEAHLNPPASRFLINKVSSRILGPWSAPMN